VDIYGLGGVLSAALTGRPGHSDTVASLTEECPDELHRICERCLAYRPVDRYQSADELAEELDKYLKGISLPPTPTKNEEKSLTIKVPEFSIRISPRSLLKFVGFALAVLVCSFLIAAWWTGWFKDPRPATGSHANPDSQR
jgi:serine/threonine protein kinase